MKYQHVQPGWIMIAVFVPAIVFLVVAYIFQLGEKPIGLGGLCLISAVLLLLLLCFYRMKTIVEQGIIHISYGIGLIHFNLTPKNITAVREVKIPFYAGFGIRITPSGMLYNIHGNKAVEIRYGKNGTQTLRIGTPDTAALKAAIITHFSDEFVKDQS